MEGKKSLPKYNNISVLIFGAGGRQTLPMCRGFYKLGCRVTVYCSHKMDTGYMTRFKHKKILFDKSKANGEDFYTFGARLIKTGDYDLVVPMGDKTAMFLSQNKEEFSKYAKIAVNDWDVFSKVIDKSKTMLICEENGIPAPRTLYSEDPVTEIREKGLSYPVVVKPKTGVGSIGFNIVHSEEKLKKLLEDYDNSNGPLLVQEYIEQGDQPQYGAEFFRDRDGVIRSKLIFKKPRWFPLDGGSTVCAVSVHDDEILDSCTRLLDALNWEGTANFDLVWDEKEKKAKILEINPRVSAIVKLSFVVGIDVARLMVENAMGYPVTDMTEYEDNKQISCLLVDCLWLVKSKDRFRSKPSWFARWRIKDTIFSWDDPIPTIGFIYESFTGYRSAMSKRKRVE